MTHIFGMVAIAVAQSDGHIFPGTKLAVVLNNSIEPSHKSAVSVTVPEKELHHMLATIDNA